MAEDPKTKLKYLDNPIGKTREQLIRQQVPPHSKVPTKAFYDNFDKIKWTKKSIWEEIKRRVKND